MDYVEIARFASRLSAETVAHALDEYGIPFQVSADDGGGSWGMMLEPSAHLLVPASRAEEALLVLDGIVQILPFREDEQFGAA